MQGRDPASRIPNPATRAVDWEALRSKIFFSFGDRPFLFQVADALEGLGGAVVVAKGGQAEIAFSTGPKAGARGAHHMGLGEQPVKEGPAVHRGFEPYIGRVHAAVNLVTHVA